MKKIISVLLTLTVILTCVMCISSCKKSGSNTEVTTGLVYKIKTDDKGEKYAIASEFTISDDDAEKVASGYYEDLLTEITVPDTYEKNGVAYPVTEIEAGVFTNQVIITKVILGSNIKKIGAYCFAGCSNLSELTLPFIGGSVDAVNDAKTLGYLFGTTEATGTTAATVSYNESGTATYYIPDCLKKVTVTGSVLSDYAFNAMPIETVVLNDATTAIGAGSFQNMPNLAKFKFPAELLTIGASAFGGDKALYQVDFSLSTKLTTVFDSAFNGCTKLGYGMTSAFTLPNSVTKIYSRAFYGCTSLTSVNLKNTAITEIPSYAFYGCEKLNSATYAASVTVATGAFGNCAETFQSHN